MREYPPYGRTIAAHVVRGQKPICVAVMLSSRWGYFNHVPKICIKPDEWTAGRYEFRYLAGMHVVAVPGDDCTELMLAELLVELMAAAPGELWAYGVDGQKLYDLHFPSDISAWVRDIRLRAGLNWRDGWATVQSAEKRMAAAQKRALDQWMVEQARIQERRGLDEWIRWANWQEFGVKDRVRELFADPWQAPGETRAA